MGKMWRHLLTACSGVGLLLCAGCMTGPILDNPMLIRPDPTVSVQNPIWLPSDPGAYGKVFEKVLNIVDDYFEIRRADRWDGYIDTFPRISPGLEQFWKPGSPDAYQRLEATLQTIRHRAVIKIDPASDGGFFVKVIVYKELEDLARPARATAGAAAFRSDITLERQFEVIDPTVTETNWIPVGPDGRDKPMEELILQRLKKCL
jgi:hypothetical protein